MNLVVEWHVLQIPVEVVIVDKSIQLVCYLFYLFITYFHWFIMTNDDAYKRLSRWQICGFWF